MSKIISNNMIHIDGTYTYGHVKKMEIDRENYVVVFTPKDRDRTKDEQQIGLPMENRFGYIDFSVLKQNFNLNIHAINDLIEELIQVKAQMEAMYVSEELDKE